MMLGSDGEAGGAWDGGHAGLYVRRYGACKMGGIEPARIDGIAASMMAPDGKI